MTALHRASWPRAFRRGGVAGPLMDASGKRCYTQAGIRELTRRLASTGRSVQFTVSRPPVTVQLMDERWRRLTAGCAVVTDVSAAADGLGLVVQIWQRG